MTLCKRGIRIPPHPPFLKGGRGDFSGRQIVERQGLLSTLAVRLRASLVTAILNAPHYKQRPSQRLSQCKPRSRPFTRAP